MPVQSIAIRDFPDLKISRGRFIYRAELFIQSLEAIENPKNDQLRIMLRVRLAKVNPQYQHRSAVNYFYVITPTGIEIEQTRFSTQKSLAAEPPLNLSAVLDWAKIELGKL